MRPLAAGPDASWLARQQGALAFLDARRSRRRRLGGAPPRLSLWHRLLLSLPRLRRDPDKAPLGERLREAIVKPVEPSAAAKAKAADEPLSVEELEDAVRYADDKERLTGLLLAPVAAAIGLIIISDRISHNPAQFLKSGKVNPQHVSVSLYHELELVLLGLAVVMLVTAYLPQAPLPRHRHGPVRAGGLQPPLLGLRSSVRDGRRLAAGARLPPPAGPARGRRRDPSRPGPDGGVAGAHPRSSRPQPNKRYTPRTAPPKRSPPKPENEQKAG